MKIPYTILVFFVLSMMLLPIIEVFLTVLKKKNYYKTYKSIEVGRWESFICLIFIIVFNKKIYADAVNVMMKPIGVSKDKLNEIFNKYNIEDDMKKTQILEGFIKYQESGYVKKIGKDKTLNIYDEIMSNIKKSEEIKNDINGTDNK